MDIAIVDDNPQDRETLAHYIHQYMQEHFFTCDISFFASGEELLASANPGIKDWSLLFLDIFMGEITGVELALNLRAQEVQYPIIFVSSSNSFAQESYNVGALWYLVKPWTAEVFNRVMDLAMRKLEESARFLDVPEKREPYKIRLEDIVYVDYYDHYVQFHTTNGIKRTYVFRFADVEKALAPYANFLLCYRNTLVNMDCIESVDGKFFVLRDSTRLPINRMRLKEIKAAYTDYLFSRL